MVNIGMALSARRPCGATQLARGCRVRAPPSDSDKISAGRPDLVVFNGYANQYPRLSKAQGGIVELSLPEAGHHPFVNRTVPGDDSEIPRQRR